jgi:hypothetical protein
MNQVNPHTFGGLAASRLLRTASGAAFCNRALIMDFVDRIAEGHDTGGMRGTGGM